MCIMKLFKSVKNICYFEDFLLQLYQKLITFFIILQHNDRLAYNHVAYVC